MNKIDALKVLLDRLAIQNDMYAASIPRMNKSVLESLAQAGAAAPARSAPKRSAPPKPRSCRRCGQVGHYSNRCPT